jgi:gamma-glutamyl-gamma-aminobutyrate hydrolase PuuD
MTPFDLQSHLNDVYATYPEATRQPVIGITANFNDGDACLRDRYYKQIVAAHGTPVIIPPVSDKNVIINILDNIDGLLLSGGSDYNPLWAGEEPSPHLHGINASRDLAELMTVRLAYNRQIPILGICRGIQTLAMALDGKVRQDIYTQNAAGSNAAPLIKHSQDADRNEPTHSVEIKERFHSLFHL